MRGIFKYILQKIQNLAQPSPLSKSCMSHAFWPHEFSVNLSKTNINGESTLRGLQWKICLVYIDDIIIFSRCLEDHLKHSATVFDRLSDAGLKLKPSKCRFGCHKVPYLGFITTTQGIKPDPKKVEAVRTYPTSTNLTQVRAFLGLANYYRHFVQNFSCIARPLIQLTRKNTPFLWRLLAKTCSEF